MIKEGKRFRTLDCLKVLKSILRNRKKVTSLSPEIKDKLFFIYTHFIFHRNEEVKWAVSTYLKDQSLKDSHVNWLISHTSDNELVLNRVLRYPKQHSLISKWAKNIYEEQKHLNRLSEIIALLIKDEIPDFIDTSNRSMILWAIYYARVDIETRKRLFKKYYDIESLDELIKICVRLGYDDVLDYVHNQLGSNPRDFTVI